MMLPCLNHSIAYQIKQRRFNEIYSNMQIWVSKRILKLCLYFINESEEFNFTQHNDRRDNLEPIHKK